MSLTSLPSYAETPFIHRMENGTPAYTVEPQPYEQRIGQNGLLRTRPLGEFVKQTKNGAISLRLVSQKPNARLPTYGLADEVEGTVIVSKPDGITSVDVKIEGILQLQEIAEGGTTTVQLCFAKSLLWSKETNKNNICPTSLPFRLTLPSTYIDGDRTYSLPPSYEERLSGVPGFRANVVYAVQIIINSKPNVVPNLVKSALFGTANNANISTPFIYCPRTRPAIPLPGILCLSPSNRGFVESPEWGMFEDRSMTSKVRGGQEITSKLYLPASRVFCLRQPIPFHLTFASSAFSLAAFLPLLPTASRLSTKKYTKIELLRQCTVDVRNRVFTAAKTDIWRVDCIGRGLFRHTGDGPGWISFSGEIVIKDNVDIGAFRASGLSVKDYIVLSMTPPDPVKCPFRELRQVVPVQLTTDPWTPNIENHNFSGSVYSMPSSDNHLVQLPEMD